MLLQEELRGQSRCVPFAPDCRQAVCNRMGPVWALPGSADSGKLQLDMQITRGAGAWRGRVEHAIPVQQLSFPGTPG